MAIISGGLGLRKNQEQKPIIINGDCAVAQRGTSESSVTTSSLSTADRMALGISSLGTWTVTQESLSSGNAYAAGFKKAYRIDCTSADTSPSSSDNLFMQYKMEGNTLQAFKKGTANAEKYTLAFWVKSNKTGTAQVSLIDGDNSRIVGATYTISSANTWEHKVLNYPADTTGAFDNDNAKSLEIEWALDAGSDFTSGAVPNTWEASSNADRSVNDLALGDSTDNDWAITGIQLEVGEYDATTLPPFQFEDYADNLRRCQRYFCQVGHVGSTQSGFPARAYSSSGMVWAVPVPVPFRAAPSVSLLGTIRAFAGDSATYKDSTSVSVNSYGNTNSTIVMLQSTGFSGITDNKAYNVHAINDTSYIFIAEL